jgi:hypothetical protein
MAHLWLQNANEAKVRKCERLNRTQLAPASRVDAQIAIHRHVESGTTCRSSACFGPAKRPRNTGGPGAGLSHWQWQGPPGNQRDAVCSLKWLPLSGGHSWPGGRRPADR